MFIDYTFCKSKSPKLHSIKIMSVYIHKNLHSRMDIAAADVSLTCQLVIQYYNSLEKEKPFAGRKRKVKK